MVSSLFYLTRSPSVHHLTSPNLLLKAQQQQDQAFGIPIWIWFVLIALVIIVAVIWTLYEESEAGKTQSGATVTESTQPAEAESVPAPEVRPDNLKKISGIGPKIEQLLKRNGIMTFAQLAETDVSRLQALLDEVEYDLADPTTWPEQARNLL